MTSPARLTRPRSSGHGSEEFVAFLRNLRHRPDLRGLSPPSEHVEPDEDDFAKLGVYESDGTEGYVNVRVDSTGELVEAKFSGFPPGYRLEVGDELCVEFVADEWRTLPEVRHTIEHSDRIEFWSANRTSGEFRFLAESYYE